jgi:triosephosphate isomerase (TIM)
MRPCVVAGNWKMNTDAESAVPLAVGIRDGLPQAEDPRVVQVILCPPFPLLGIIRDTIAGSPIGLGAQNMYVEDAGAYTGEVAAPMLRSVGCTHVILGHSERRQYFYETDAFINAKTRKALAHGLIPIVCVGETLEQRERGVTQSVIDIQVKQCLADLSSDDVRRLILAYEPVWAIGTGRTATPEQAQEVHVYIRDLVASLYDRGTADAFVIQYGGSINADNAAELFAQPDVDGGLIGGASLSAERFLAIIGAALNSDRG